MKLFKHFFRANEDLIIVFNIGMIMLIKIKEYIENKLRYKWKKYTMRSKI